MSRIAVQRCHVHFDREAVAKCVECTEFFCRECITEHEGRIVCAACLQKLALAAEKTGASRLPLSRLASLFMAGVGLIGAWLFFYTLGRLLLSVPSEFH